MSLFFMPIHLTHKSFTNPLKLPKAPHFPLLCEEYILASTICLLSEFHILSDSLCTSLCFFSCDCDYCQFISVDLSPQDSKSVPFNPTIDINIYVICVNICLGDIRNSPTLLQSVWPILHFHLQRMRIPAAAQSHQHLVLSVFWNFSHFQQMVLGKLDVHMQKVWTLPTYY